MPRGDDLAATHQARCSGAAVHVDLSAVPVLSGSAAHADRVVLRSDGIDPPATHTVAHQPDEI